MKTPHNPVILWTDTDPPLKVTLRDLRDLCAVAALAGQLAEREIADTDNSIQKMEYKWVAKHAYEFADAMLAEREREEPGE